MILRHIQNKANMKQAPKPDVLKVKQWNDMHRKILEKSIAFVCENTSNINKIYILLIQKKVLTRSEQEEIDSHPAQMKKMFELIALLLKKGHKSLTIFKEVLIETGNEEAEEVIRGNEYAVVKKVKQTGKVDSTDSEEDSDDKKPKKKKKKTGKKKLFSVYEAEPGKGFSVFTATDDEESSESDSEDLDAVLDTIDEDNPDINALLDYLQYAEQKSKLMMYYPQNLVKITRFKDLPTEAILPKDNYQDALIKFKCNRAIFLKLVAFYGPATIPLTSYEIKLNICIASSIPGKDEPLGEISELIEVKLGQLMYVGFKNPVPIRPHIWHKIQFTIKGQERMAAQNEGNRDKFLYMDYQLEQYDAVRLEFDTSKDYAIGQIPEFCFYKAKDRIPSVFFPKLPTDLPDPSIPTPPINTPIKDPAQDSCGCSIS